MTTEYIDSLYYDSEAERFNLIANNLDRFAAILETISDSDVKEKSKQFLSQIENLVLQSPEWIYNDGLPGLNMGIFGSINSGWKEVLSVFVDNNEQDYIEDMGIRVKHVIKLTDQSKHLLLIRHDSENIPDMEFSNWADCGIFVFSLESERSYKDALLSHKEFVSFRMNNKKYAPTILVGCRDGIMQNNTRIKSYLELKEVAKQYGFDEYIEVRHQNGYNTFFLFEFCTLLAHKWKGRLAQTKKDQSVVLRPRSDTDANMNNKKRKSNKRKTCLDEEFKTPTSAPNTKKLSKNAKRTSSINESTNETERRQSFTLFKSKNKSLPRSSGVAPETSSSFSSSSSISDQNATKDASLPNDNIVMQGILYKGRNKKWVTITNDAKMFYHNSKQDYLNCATPKFIDLQFSNAKVPGNHSQNGHFSRATKSATKKVNDDEEKKIIKINTHNGKNQCITRVYKAASEEERNAWMTTITDAIFHHYTQTKIDSKYQAHAAGDSVDDVLIRIRKQFGNDICAECGLKNPNWLVYNMGILICDRCSGGHRNLGVEVSKVCSLKLDGMDKIRIQILEAFGNTLFNSVMEAKLSLTDDVKPTPDGNTIDDWLRKKYVLRKFIPPLPLPQDDIQKQLIFAIQENDRRYQLTCLMNSTKDQLNLPYDVKDSRTALMIASRVADIVAVQLLLWNAVDPSIKDNDGLNALSFASIILDGKNSANESKMIEIQELLKKFKTPIQQLYKLNPAESA